MDENEENNVPIKLWKKAHLKKPKRLKKKEMEFSLKAVQYPACCRWGCSHLALSSFVDGWQEKMALEILQRIYNTQNQPPSCQKTSHLYSNLVHTCRFFQNFMQNMNR